MKGARLRMSTYQLSGVIVVADFVVFREVVFDSGWIEDHFFLYGDHDCEDLLIKGMKGNYGDSVYGMQIGSWKID